MGPFDACFSPKVTDERCGLTRLAEAELSFYTAYEMWAAEDAELIKLAKANGKAIEPMIQKPPAGYSAQMVVRDKDTQTKLHRVEVLVAAVLDAFYALTERIVSVTDRLNARSGNKLWTDTKVRGPGIKKGSVIEQNLINLFVDGNSTKAAIAGTMQKIIAWRGSRTHRLHFYAYVEYPPAAVVFADKPPYTLTPQTIRFTDIELKAAFKAIGLFIGWWIGASDLQLEQATAKPSP
jgi:hypothetical protein